MWLAPNRNRCFWKSLINLKGWWKTQIIHGCRPAGALPRCSMNGHSFSEASFRTGGEWMAVERYNHWGVVHQKINMLKRIKSIILKDQRQRVRRDTDVLSERYLSSSERRPSPDQCFYVHSEGQNKARFSFKLTAVSTEHMWAFLTRLHPSSSDSGWDRSDSLLDLVSRYPVLLWTDRLSALRLSLLQTQISPASMLRQTEVSISTKHILPLLSNTR